MESDAQVCQAAPRWAAGPAVSGRHLSAAFLVPPLANSLKARMASRKLLEDWEKLDLAALWGSKYWPGMWEAPKARAPPWRPAWEGRWPRLQAPCALTWQPARISVAVSWALTCFPVPTHLSQHHRWGRREGLLTPHSLTSMFGERKKYMSRGACPQ